MGAPPNVYYPYWYFAGVLDSEKNTLHIGCVDVRWIKSLETYVTECSTEVCFELMPRFQRNALRSAQETGKTGWHPECFSIVTVARSIFFSDLDCGFSPSNLLSLSLQLAGHQREHGRSLCTLFQISARVRPSYTKGNHTSPLNQEQVG